MSFFTRNPLNHLRAVRRQVFGFGRSRAAAELAEYRRDAATFRLPAEPCALPEGEIQGINFYAQGWLVRADTLAKNGIERPMPNDVLTVAGENWTVFEAGGHCFARRSYGGDIMLYTKLTDHA